MISESSKPLAGRVAEHGFWPAERQYSRRTGIVAPGRLWGSAVRKPPLISLSDILTPDRMKVPLCGASRRDVTIELLDLAAAAGGIGDRRGLLESIASRERTRSTGVGRGWAIPHAKTSQVSDLIMVAGLCAEPIDFCSTDGVGVKLVVMVICPERCEDMRVRVLRSVTDMMGLASVRGMLLEAGSADELHEIIRRYEAAA